MLTMDAYDQFRQLLRVEIQNLTDQMVQGGAGEEQLNIVQSELERIAQLSFAAGQAQSLSSLITTDDLQARFGVSRRRANAIAKHRHEKYSIGFQLTGTNQWYFNPSDLPLLQPDASRPRGNKQKRTANK